MSPGQLLEFLAVSTWQRLSDAALLDVRQGETSITDHLLLEIARLRDPSIRVLKTPQHLERIKGTDWEWWIGTPACGWPYAAQAKRIHVETGRYGGLGQKVGRIRQAEVLERFASANRAVPLYCFYNHVERPDFTPYWHCHRRPVECEQLGCSIVPIRVVKRALSTHGARSFDRMHKSEVRSAVDVPPSVPGLCRAHCAA